MEITNSKAYTNTEQSKILAQIIDKETADFCWGIDQENSNDNVFVYNCTPYPLPWKDYTARDFYLPCWSLAALLNIIPQVKLDSVKQYDQKLWRCSSYFASDWHNSDWHDNPINAVFEVVVKLNEINYYDKQRKTDII